MLGSWQKVATSSPRKSPDQNETTVFHLWVATCYIGFRGFNSGTMYDLHPASTSSNGCSTSPAKAVSRSPSQLIGRKNEAQTQKLWWCHCVENKLQAMHQNQLRAADPLVRLYLTNDFTKQTSNPKRSPKTEWTCLTPTDALFCKAPCSALFFLNSSNILVRRCPCASVLASAKAHIDAIYGPPTSFQLWFFLINYRARRGNLHPSASPADSSLSPLLSFGQITWEEGAWEV